MNNLQSNIESNIERKQKSDGNLTAFLDTHLSVNIIKTTKLEKVKSGYSTFTGETG
jgi:hypothetical protein